MKTGKYVIYQTFPRLFGNYRKSGVKNGSLAENGCGKFNSYTDRALDAIRDLGATHVWYTGVLRHSTCTDYSAYGLPRDHQAIVKGKAGSPYAIKDYYDVDPDLADDVSGRMQEFEQLVERTHKAGMKVVIDFVPNHVARSYHSTQKPACIDDLGQHDRTDTVFAPMNNFYYLPGQRLELPGGAQEEDFGYSEFPARATGNNCFNAAPGQNDWYETVKLNYGVDCMAGGAKYFTPVPDTWHKMLDILLVWSEKGIDGFRCDMVEMTPVEFWEWAIPRVKSRRNVVFIAEIYNPATYREYIHRGHFDFLYDKAGMYDTLRRIICHEAPASDLAACWQAIEDIGGHMLFFLENHDEQRIASRFFAGKTVVAENEGCGAEAGIPGMAVIALLGVNPVMIYNGQETGEEGMNNEGFSGIDGRTSIFDYGFMDSVLHWANDGRFDGGLLDDARRRLREMYRKILQIAVNEKAISEGRFYDLAYCNSFPSGRVAAFLRQHGSELILVAANFDRKTGDVCIRIPREAFDALQILDNVPSQVTDLMDGTQSICALTRACPYHVTLPACSAKILKFVY